MGNLRQDQARNHIKKEKQRFRSLQTIILNYFNQISKINNGNEYQ